MGGGIRHIDCLCKYFEAVIYWCKKQQSVVIFIYRIEYLWIDTNKREFIQCKTMKCRLYSLQYISLFTIYLNTKIITVPFQYSNWWIQSYRQ